MRLPLLLILMLASMAGCALPRPFQGRPGATAERLLQPPPARLAIPSPGAALLGNAASAGLATAVAAALVQQDVPAFAEPPRPGDWRLVIGAETRADTVVPEYTVQNPAGKPQGTTEGLPIPQDAWSSAAPATLTRAAADAAPRVSALLTRIEAARRQSDPNSLLNRPTQIAFTGVSGAPGDGNTSLARQMRAEMTKLGQPLEDTPEKPDFTLSCKVTTTPAAGGQSRIEIDWLVQDAKGEERGKVVQLNDIQTGSLDHYWGDVAMVVAQEAAGGVRDVILNQSGAKR